MSEMTLEEIIEALRDAAGHTDLPEGQLCHCGTQQAAFDTSLKLMSQMVDNDCPLWALQVSSAMFLIGRALSHGMGSEEKIAEMVLAEMTKSAMTSENGEKLSALIKQMYADD